MTNLNLLDVDELMHLALHATDNDTPDKAISHLKRLLAIQPENGKARYLLGALHAEIGMYEKAAEEMTQALENDPGLPETAVFQLGLLHITAGRVSEAELVWQRIDSNTDNPLFYFKTGMLQMVQDEFAEAAESLRKGIERNTVNEDLNNDMKRVLHKVEDAGGLESTAITGGADALSQSEGQRMLLSIYNRQDDD